MHLIKNDHHSYGYIVLEQLENSLFDELEGKIKIKHHGL